jgi:hypothetical protein
MCSHNLQASTAAYEGLFQQYTNLAYSLGQQPDISLSLDPQQQLTETRSAMATITLPGGRPSIGDAGGMAAAAAAAGGGAGPAGPAGRGRVRGAVGDMTYLLGSGMTVTARDGSEVPQQVRDLSPESVGASCARHGTT